MKKEYKTNELNFSILMRLLIAKKSRKPNTKAEKKIDKKRLFKR